MSESIPGAVITATFLLLASVTAIFFIDVWTGHSSLASALSLQQVERANTLIALQSDKTYMDLGCNTLLAVADNTGRTAITDFAGMDVLADYRDTSDNKVTIHPNYNTGWTVAGINPDKRDPNLWNPEEEATFVIPISPLMGFDTTGTVVMVTPQGVSDSGYFSCPNDYYFHAETIGITGSAFYQLKGIPSDGPATTLSAVFTNEQVGRVRPSPNDGKFVVPLTNTSQIRATTWDVTYRLRRDKADFGFVWSTNADEITLAFTDLWWDIDLSAYVPVGATGVIVEVVNTGVGLAGGVVRGKEDPRNYMANPPGPILLEPETHQWQMVKVDANRLIQGYITSTDIHFKLLGYTIGPDPSFFSAPTDVTTGTTGSWVTANLSGNVDADADGAILLVVGDAKKYGIREMGSSFSNVDLKLPSKGLTMYLVGLNSSKEFEAYLDNGINIYLVGQTKGSVVYYSDDLTVTNPATGSWATLDADTFSVPADANGLILTAEVATAGDLGLRHGDSTDDWNKRMLDATHLQGAVGINSDNQWQQYLGETDSGVFIAAYTRLVRMDVHADIDVLVLQADGTIRATLDTDVANTGNVTDTDWQTFIATFPFAEYTVVDNTDYLEIDLFAHATTNLSGENVTVDFRIDDPTLPLADQPRVLP